MQRILIMGDSWGDWHWPLQEGVSRTTDEHHVTGMIKDFGHNVTNCAKFGSSNLKAIERAELECQDKTFDWVIWFHTEVFRDSHMFDSDKPFYLNYVAEELAKQQYIEFETFRSNNNLRAIVIGGQAPTFPFIRDFIKIDMLIDDWRSQILGKKVPFSQIFSLNEFADILFKKTTCLDSFRDRLKFLGEVEIIYNICDSRRDLFPNGAHPGEKPHRDLADRIHDFILTH
jgi:hypothetical protein